MTFHSLLPLFFEITTSYGAEVVTGGAVQVEAIAVNKLNPANYTGERFGVHPFNVEQKLRRSGDPNSTAVGASQSYRRQT